MSTSNQGADELYDFAIYHPCETDSGTYINYSIDSREATMTLAHSIVADGGGDTVVVDKNTGCIVFIVYNRQEPTVLILSEKQSEEITRLANAALNAEIAEAYISCSSAASSMLMVADALMDTNCAVHHFGQAVAIGRYFASLNISTEA